MFGDSIGYIVGYNNTILKSEDGGSNWFPIEANVYLGPFNNYINYKDLFFFNSRKGFIGGTGGKLAKTEDGGRSWTDTSLAEEINSINFVMIV